jgi:hypothetical protein
MNWLPFIRFLGRIVGSVVCAVVFALFGFVTGLLFPWFDPEKPDR